MKLFGAQLFLALILVPFHGAIGQQDASVPYGNVPTAKEIYYQLDSTVQRLRRVRVLMADRSVTFKQSSSKPDVLVRWHELYVNGDNAQLRSDSVPHDSAEWWKNAVSSNGPLSSKTIGDYGGIKYCYRPDGDPSHAEIISSPKERHLPYSIWYGASSSPRPLGSFFAPFIKKNRSWEASEPKVSAGLLLADQLARSDYARWDVIGREVLANETLIKVVVPISDGPYVPKLTSHDGKLEMSSVWNVWFTDDEHHFPVRIESEQRYVYNGQEVPLRFKSDGRRGAVYSARDYKEFSNGIWYPQTGNETVYTVAVNPVVSGVDPRFSADTIVEQYVKTGGYTVHDSLVPVLVREWKILAIDEIDPMTQLWIDPPEGAMLNRLDTGVEQIVGKTIAETSKVLGYSPEGARSPLGTSSWRPGRLLLVAINAVAIIVLVLAIALRRRRLSA